MVDMMRAELVEAKDEIAALRSRDLYVTKERDRLRAELASAGWCLPQ